MRCLRRATPTRLEKLTVRLLALQPLKQLVILCMSANPEPVNVIILQQAKNAVV
ncbi:MAG: hypothetical protein V7K12_19480 [Nostoc sp.]